MDGWGNGNFWLFDFGACVTHQGILFRITISIQIQPTSGLTNIYFLSPPVSLGATQIQPFQGWLRFVQRQPFFCFISI
jgi:hypothetical protein